MRHPDDESCPASSSLLLFSTCSETMLGSLRSCAARRPANLMATSFARRTKAGSAESVTSSVSLGLSFSIWASGHLPRRFPACSVVRVGCFVLDFYCPFVESKHSCLPNLSLPLPSNGVVRLGFGCDISVETKYSLFLVVFLRMGCFCFRDDFWLLCLLDFWADF